MKYFLIIFGLATVLFGSGMLLLAYTYESGVSFFWKGMLGIALAFMGVYLIIVGIKEFRAR
jgi:hypothetical protein